MDEILASNLGAISVPIGVPISVEFSEGVMFECSKLHLEFATDFGIGCIVEGGVTGGDSSHMDEGVSVDFVAQFGKVVLPASKESIEPSTQPSIIVV